MKKSVIGILLLSFCTSLPAEMIPHTKLWHLKLQSLDPNQVLIKLDLDKSGLEAVKKAADNGDQATAFTELLNYYRKKYPAPPQPDQKKKKFERADQICNHIFQWGPYKEADYGKDINWEDDPANDIEWVAAVYRFFWADDLSRAYQATQDDKYVRAFIELTCDWIAKHPLNDWTQTHYKYKRWKGFAWLDLQTGIRATNAVTAFKAMVHSKAITPEFLAVFLASMYDHQHKTTLIPMGMVHNKAIFEQRGVLNICQTFGEFKETKKWARLAVDRASENLLAQTTTDGIQREWCGSYHQAVLRDAIDVMQKAEALDLTASDDYRDRIHKMCDYVFAAATPDLAWPMFGDTARKTPTTDDRRHFQLYSQLIELTDLWDNPKYAARAKLDLAKLPKQTSYAFEDSGIYFMRSNWGTDGIYMALHCPPKGISSHDQPDNGTFELYAYGRWLMTDSGFYTYGHDPQGRAWHRQSQVHQTLTLNRKDTKIDGKLLLWKSTPQLDALVVENRSYDSLVHRRTVWFVDKKFFLFLDEAIGNAPGDLHLHWQPAAGEVNLDKKNMSVTTNFPNGNVLIKTLVPTNAEIESEDGWFAWQYGKRIPRKMFSVKCPGTAPALFATAIIPYRSKKIPEVKDFIVGLKRLGDEEAEITVTVSGEKWQAGRSLDKLQAWCTKQ